MIGELAILNVGDGDTKLTFDKKKPEEVKRASRVVTDMLKRGFAILIEVGKKNGRPLYQRAEGFDPKTNEYIIVGAPDDDADDRPAPRGKRGASRKRVPAGSTSAVAVARSSGG